jgi:multidrug efflux pump
VPVFFVVVRRLFGEHGDARQQEGVE